MVDWGFSKLSYGAANLGNLYRPITDDDAWNICEAAWDAGIRYFDTAPHYGLGLSERRLGAFLRTKPRESFRISTKVGRVLEPNPHGLGQLDTENDFYVPSALRRRWDFSDDGIRRSLSDSLERLGLDRVDVVYLHDPEKWRLEEARSFAFPAMARLREEGIVDAIGVGSMSIDALLLALQPQIMDLLMVAGKYTLLDSAARDRVAPLCAQSGVGIVNAAVFNSGLLATQHPTRDAHFNYGAPSASVLGRLDSIIGVCEELAVSLPAAALQYSLRDPVVETVVAGAGSPTNINENASRINEPIPEVFWHTLVDLGLIPS